MKIKETLTQYPIAFTLAALLVTAGLGVGIASAAEIKDASKSHPNFMGIMHGKGHDDMKAKPKMDFLTEVDQKEIQKIMDEAHKKVQEYIKAKYPAKFAEMEKQRLTNTKEMLEKMTFLKAEEKTTLATKTHQEIHQYILEKYPTEAKAFFEKNKPAKEYGKKDKKDKKEHKAKKGNRFDKEKSDISAQ